MARETQKLATVAVLALAASCSTSREAICHRIFDAACSRSPACDSKQRPARECLIELRAEDYCSRVIAVQRSGDVDACVAAYERQPCSDWPTPPAVCEGLLVY